MKTIQIEIAMMKYLNCRQNLIVPNVSWGIAGLHECDLLCLSKSDYATEIEIKVSRSDLLKDGQKQHGHVHSYIARFYYAVPKNLKYVALKSIPERAGLFVVTEEYDEYLKKIRTDVHLIKECERNRTATKWPEEDRYQMARLGTLRILGLKEKILKYQSLTN